MKARKTAFLGMMSALALVLGFLESLFSPDIPFLPVGAKPGLSNIVTMYVASVMGFKGAICITLIKGIFALLTRGVTASLMSLAGGVLSTVAVCAVLRYEGKVFSFVGIGIIGAVMHNLGQLFAAMVVAGSCSLINYAKYLLIFSLITGTVTGFMLSLLMPRIERIRKITEEMKK